VLPDVGPVKVKFPRDAVGTFGPQIVKKLQRRLIGVDEMALSLSTPRLPCGGTSGHLTEIYGAEVSKQTITTITDKLTKSTVDWQSCPLERVYPMVSVDAINVKYRVLSTIL
jgi:putative transposase